MGLSAAYYAAKAGHAVQVIEAAPEPGGMAAHFQLEGLSIERFYHFVCKTDEETKKILAELGLADKLHWRPTSMGILTGGKLHDWGNPIALLRYQEMSLLSRLRYGLFALVCVRRELWDSIETQTARDWITRWCGLEVYTQLWYPLFRLKFYQYSENISAAWIWTRIRRLGRSRKSLMQEELGYIEGGSQVLVDALCKAIKNLEGTVHTSLGARQVATQGGHVTGVMTNQGVIAADKVICTIPTPFIPDLVPDLPDSLKAEYAAIHNIGICCLVFKLKKKISPHFWINISEPDIAIPGIVEFSNLRPLEGANIVYVPYYMPVDNVKFTWSDGALLEEAFGYLQRINQTLTSEDILAAHVARLRYAQPICDPGFKSRIPAIQTPIGGLQIADTCFYYPEDRGISESVRLGREMAEAIGKA